MIQVVIEPLTSFCVFVVQDKVDFRALFSAFSGDQVCDVSIQRTIKLGGHPFPSPKSMSLNVPTSPIGFCQNVIRMSCGHVFTGKNASPFMSLKISALSRLISLRDRYLIGTTQRIYNNYFHSD